MGKKKKKGLLLSPQNTAQLAFIHSCNSESWLLALSSDKMANYESHLKWRNRDAVK